MAADHPDVVCLGILVADVVGKPIERLPERGKLLMVDQIELHTGGNGANVALSLAKLGVSSALIGRVGDDGFGRFLEGDLRAHGVDVSGLTRDTAASTSVTMVVVDRAGERSFIHYPGVNRRFREQDIPFSLVASAPIFSVSGCFLMPGFDGPPLASVLRRVRQESRSLICLDTSWDSSGRWMELLGPCLRYVDYFLPSYDEAAMLSGKRSLPEMAGVFLDLGARVVVIKRGPDGAYARTAEGEEIVVPAFQVEAVDALGAGDAFVAGFLAGLSHGEGLEGCLRLGNAVGALCVTALGATTGVRPLDEVRRFSREARPRPVASV